MKDPTAKKVVDRHLSTARLPYLHKEVEALIEQVAVEMGMKPLEVRRIALTPFALWKSIRNNPEINEDIEKGFPTIGIIHLGTFSPRLWRIENYLKDKNETIHAECEESSDAE